MTSLGSDHTLLVLPKPPLPPSQVSSPSGLGLPRGLPLTVSPDCAAPRSCGSPHAGCGCYADACVGRRDTSVCAAQPQGQPGQRSVHSSRSRKAEAEAQNALGGFTPFLQGQANQPRTIPEATIAKAELTMG